jgi:hypothetical protein
VKRWLAVWRAVTRSPNATRALIVLICGVVLLGSLVMGFGYKLAMQWRDGRLELSPPDRSVSQAGR